jgi:MFS family permease
VNSDSFTQPRTDAPVPRRWKVGEQPLLPGSPSTPTHGPARRAAYFVIGVLIALTGGLGNALVMVNLTNLQGELGADIAELQWLPTAYVMGMVSTSLLLVKCRQQFGLRLFTGLALALYAAIAIAHVGAGDLASAIVVRAAHGVAASTMTVLGLYYILQACGPAQRIQGLVLGIGMPQLAPPLARLCSERLLQLGGWHGLVLFEAGLACMALACVLALRLPEGEQSDVFERRDFFTFALFVPGVCLLCAVLGLGRTVWWVEAPWIGYCLAGAIVLLTAVVALEHARSAPLLNLLWLTTMAIVKLALSVLLVRIVLAEVGASVGLMQALGLHTDQLGQLWLAMAAGSVAGLACSALTLTPARVPGSLMVALLLIAAGAGMDAFSTSQTRPANLLVSQFLLAFGGVFFLGPTFLSGFGTVLAAPANLVSFTVMFTITQNLGGLLGAALVGTVQTLREKFHSSHLVEHLTLLEPQVAIRVDAGAARLAGVLADPAQRTTASLAALRAAATREANVLAYNDVFLLIAVLACVTCAWLLAGQIGAAARQR